MSRGERPCSRGRDTLDSKKAGGSSPLPRCQQQTSGGEYSRGLRTRLPASHCTFHAACFSARSAPEWSAAASSLFSGRWHDGHELRHEVLKCGGL
jgi:hypothetical protein